MSKRPDSGSFWTICAFLDGLLADFLIFYLFYYGERLWGFFHTGDSISPFFNSFFSVSFYVHVHTWRF
jgi:hypothetical protein